MRGVLTPFTSSAQAINSSPRQITISGGFLGRSRRSKKGIKTELSWLENVPSKEIHGKVKLFG